jgi:chromosome partitioning protein
MPEGYIIAVDHLAGGVGKTTVTLNLAYALACLGLEVCGLDLDPQADLSRRINVSDSTLGAVLVNDSGKLTTVRRTWDDTGFDLVASSLESMATVDLQLVGQDMRELRLQRALAALRPLYDFILLDCPPNLSLLNVNALYAADGVIIPCQAQDKAVNQIPLFLSKLQRVQQYRQGQPAVLGIVLTMNDGTQQARAALKDLTAAYGATVFESMIPRRTALAADNRYQAPLAVYDPMNDAASAFTTLAQEVLTRAQITPRPQRAATKRG